MKSSFVATLLVIRGLELCSSKSLGEGDTDELRDRVKNLENALEKLESRIDNETSIKNVGIKEGHPVMFYVLLKDQAKHLEKKSTLVFSEVVLNVGNNYNHFDGIFVAPKQGIYLFSWSVCTSGNNFVFTELVIEDKIVSRAGEYESNGHYDCGSMTALTRMKRNDHAWIRTTNYVSGSKTNYIYSSSDVGSTSFMGVLLHSA